MESIGSEVAEQDPASHDRYMVLDQAMVFFIARGLLDLGLADEHHWAPPSFAALAASIAAVRADAGYLFYDCRVPADYPVASYSSTPYFITPGSSDCQRTLVGFL